MKTTQHYQSDTPTGPLESPGLKSQPSPELKATIIHNQFLDSLEYYVRSIIEERIGKLPPDSPEIQARVKLTRFLHHRTADSVTELQIDGTPVFQITYPKFQMTKKDGKSVAEVSWKIFFEKNLERVLTPDRYIISYSDIKYELDTTK